MNEQWKKSECKFDAAFVTIFKISKCFQRSKQKRHINVSIELGRPKIYKPFAHVQKVGTGTLATFNQSFCSASV
jgi:hypothetical protein